jgi:hypothetical protein
MLIFSFGLVMFTFPHPVLMNSSQIPENEF